MQGIARRQFLFAALSPTLKAAAPDFTTLIPEVFSRSFVYEERGFQLWDPSMVRTSDGLCHLLYSRWPVELGFDAWATHAEIAWATARRPEGPYQFQRIVMGARGGRFWDGHSVYNTCVVPWQGKFYLYYAGNRGPAEWSPSRAWTTKDPQWWVHRNNQRVGLAVANHPSGPWIRFAAPLIETGAEFGNTITATPNVVARPDGSLLMVYKTLAPGPPPFGGGVVHYPATGHHPMGPFKRHPRQMVDKSKVFGRPFRFHIDDHFEWFQDGRYYAIVKDHDEPFMTPYGRSLYLLESEDGLDWRIAAKPLVKDFNVRWDDGATERFARLEMPKLFLDKGRPRMLFLAALPEGGTRSYLMAVPLRSE